MLFPIQEMARIYAEMQQAIASGERIFSLVDAVPEIRDSSGAQAPDTLRGDIVFENVDFQYEEEKPVLRDFSLHVKQGENHRAGRARPAPESRQSSTWSAAFTNPQRAVS